MTRKIWNVKAPVRVQDHPNWIWLHCTLDLIGYQKAPTRSPIISRERWSQKTGFAQMEALRNRLLGLSSS